MSSKQSAADPWNLMHAKSIRLEAETSVLQLRILLEAFYAGEQRFRLANCCACLEPVQLHLELAML